MLLSSGIKCPPLTAPDYGRLSSTDRIYQSVITVLCEPGYVYTGDQAPQCQADTTWSRHIGTCDGLVPLVFYEKKGFKYVRKVFDRSND